MLLRSKLLLFFAFSLVVLKDKQEKHCYNTIIRIYIKQSGGHNFYIKDIFDAGLDPRPNFQEFSYI